MAINDAGEIKKKNIEAQKFFKKYLKFKYVLIAIILAILFSMYKGVFKAGVLMVAFTPLIVYSMRVSKFIPNLNIELLSATSLLLGYLFGSIPTLIFSLVAGFYGIYKANYVTYLFIIRIIVTAIITALMPILFKIEFNLYFILGILIMNVVLYFIYLVVDPDPVQNTTHRVSHLFWNLLVVRFIYVALYGLVSHI
jgi:hypothetical protein